VIAVLWVRSQRYANRMVRVGRLLVAFRGQYAEIPEWAARERDWMVKHLPGVFAAPTPSEVFGVDAGAVAVVPPVPPPPEPLPSGAGTATPPVDEESHEGPARARPAPRRGR